MVKISARITLMNIYRLESPLVVKFLQSEEESGVLSFWSEKFAEMEPFLKTLYELTCSVFSGGADSSHVSEYLADFSDQLQFWGDVFSIDGNPVIRDVLELFVQRFLFPVLLESLLLSADSLDAQMRAVSVILTLYRIHKDCQCSILSSIIFKAMFSHTRVSNSTRKDDRDFLAELCGEPIRNPYREHLFSHCNRGDCEIMQIFLLALWDCDTEMLLDKYAFAFLTNLVPSTSNNRNSLIILFLKLCILYRLQESDIQEIEIDKHSLYLCLISLSSSTMATTESGTQCDFLTIDVETILNFRNDNILFNHKITDDQLYSAIRHLANQVISKLALKH